MIGFPKPPSRAAEKRLRLQLKTKRQREVYAQVDAREKYRCRHCARPLPAMQRHHHHIRFRSKGGRDTTANVVLICAEAHAELHAYRLFIVGDDANGVLRFRR